MELTMTNGDSSSKYKERLEAFRKTDADRDALVAEIIKEHQKLQNRYAEICDDYNNEVESRRMWQTKAKAFDEELARHRQNAGSNSFVLALIDGDGAIFQDHLLKSGKEGGSKAAHKLHSSIKTHLLTTYPDAYVNDWNIVVQVFLSLEKLAPKLVSCGLVTHPTDVYDFARSFGHAQALFSMIDVGAGKERADHKIRETLRVFLPNAQCKHVFFGPCHDTGYKVVLEPNREHAARITLIETRRAESAFRELGMEITNFPEVFRTEDLPSTFPSGAISLPFASGKPNHDSPNVKSTSPVTLQSPSSIPGNGANTVSWATVGKSGGVPKTVSIAPMRKGLSNGRRYCLLNINDERLDQPLPRYDTGAEIRFSELSKLHGNYCNVFHLLGDCAKGNYCNYTHGERLGQDEQLVLKHKARSIKCLSGYACRDVNCIFGHNCKFGKECTYKCMYDNCRTMEMKPAKRVYEDGEEEFLQPSLDKVRKA